MLLSVIILMVACYEYDHNDYNIEITPIPTASDNRLTPEQLAFIREIQADLFERLAEPLAFSPGFYPWVSQRDRHATAQSINISRIRIPVQDIINGEVNINRIFINVMEIVQQVIEEREIEIRRFSVTISAYPDHGLHMFLSSENFERFAFGIDDNGIYDGPVALHSLNAEELADFSFSEIFADYFLVLPCWRIPCGKDRETCRAEC